MLRKLAISSLGGAIALSLAASAASAAPGAPGTQAFVPQGVVTLTRMGHMSMGRVGGIHMGPRFYGARIGHGPRFYSYNFRHHRHNRFFFVGVPYYYPYYDNYYYDDYNDGCWWSRRYHRWVCPSY